jgi:hypothetical protein
VASRVFVLGFAAVVLGAVAPGARADNGFVWAAPASCPDEGNVRDRIERRLGLPVDGSVHGIEVAIARDEVGFVATIDARGVTLANGVRTLRSPRCEELADAVAVVVARLATEARVQAETARRSTAIPRASASASASTAAAARRGPGMWGGGLRALAVSGVGTLPGIGVAGEVSVYARRKKYFGELGGARWARSAMYLSTGAPGAVDVGLITGIVRIGWSPPDMYIRAWGSFEMGPMSGEGIALVDSQLGTGRWTALGGGFGVIWPMFQHVRLVGTVEFLAPVQQVKFVLRDGGEIYSPSAAVARCALGLELGWR